MEPAELQRAFAGWADDHPEELKAYRDVDHPSIEAAVAHDRGLQQLLFDAGWSRWGWPEEAGGLGGSPLLRAALYESMWASDVPLPDAFAHLEIMGPTLQRFAPPFLSAHLGPKLRGEEYWGQGFSEPEAGSDLGSLRLRAVPRNETFVVTGQKTWSSLGHLADRCMLMARTGAQASAHRGITMLWVDLGSPGVTKRPIACAHGHTYLAEIFFDDVVVPAERVIGEVDGGWAVAMYLLQWERGMFAWQRQAWLHRRIDDLLRHPALPAHAATRIGEAYEAVFALRVRSGATVQALAAGRDLGPDISVDKILLATAEQLVFDAARELLGPAFAMEDHPAAAAWRRDWWFSRPASVYGGSGEIQRSIVGERLLGLPR